MKTRASSYREQTPEKSSEAESGASTSSMSQARKQHGPIPTSDSEVSNDSTNSSEGQDHSYRSDCSDHSDRSDCSDRSYRSDCSDQRDLHNKRRKKQANPDSTEANMLIVEDNERKKSCLSGFSQMYKNGVLTDVRLRVDRRIFPCHKAFLAASSEYFHLMFTAGMEEQNKEEIKINGIDAQTMSSVLEYLYSGKCQVSLRNVENLLVGADFLQLSSLKSKCALHMKKHITVKNCLHFYFLSRQINCEDLRRNARKILMKHFSEITKTSEFLDLSSSQLSKLLENYSIPMDEEDLFSAVLEWLKQDLNNRKQHIFLVFSKLHYSEMRNNFFVDKVMRNKILVEEPRLKALLDDVIQFNFVENRLQELDVIIEPRCGGNYERFIVLTTRGRKYGNDYAYLYPDLVAAESHMDDLSCPRKFEGYSKNPVILGVDDKLFTVGGRRHKSVVCCSEAFVWTEIKDDQETRHVSTKDMMHEREQFSMAQVDNDVYVVGGRRNHAQNEEWIGSEILDNVEVFNWDKKSWDIVEHMPMALQNTCSIGFGGKLYVFGGKYQWKNVEKNDVFDVSCKAYCYDPESKTWTTLADMPTARAWAGCAIFRKQIYVIGGGREVDSSPYPEVVPTDCVEMYDPTTDTWSAGPSLPQPLCGAGVLKYNATIYVIGGRSNVGRSLNMYHLDPCTVKWVKNSESLPPEYFCDSKHADSHLGSYTVLKVWRRNDRSEDGNDISHHSDYSNTDDNYHDERHSDDYHTDNTDYGHRSDTNSDSYYNSDDPDDN